MPRVYHATLPPVVTSLLSAFEVSISFGLSGISTLLTCAGLPGYGARLSFWMLLPAALVATTLALVRVCGGRLVRWGLPAVLRLLFLLYPTVTQVAFETFPCYDLGADGGRWLIADVSIECDGDEHRHVTFWAWVAIAIYPLGIFASYAALLRMARDAIVSGKPTPLSRALGFLHREFVSSYFAWELAEMARRLLLVGFLVPVAPGSLIQLACGLMISLVYLVLQLQARSYRQLSHNFLATAASFSLVVLFVGALLVRVGELTGTQEVERFLPPHLRFELNVPPLAITLGLVGSVVGSLIVLALLLAQELAREAVRLQRVRQLRTELERIADEPRRTVLLAALDRHTEVLDEAKAREAAASQIFGPNGLHPMFWGVSKEQLLEFREEVVKAIARGEIKGQPIKGQPYFYSQDKFDDPAIGPNMHQVNSGLIKPITLEARGMSVAMPSLSYALMRNLATGGRRCDLFISHAWDEGVFELIDNALKAWPAGCQGAYICCLSNPQNLDIDELLKHQDGSPFVRILKSGAVTDFVMLANSNTPIHTRLWCVLEAHTARQQGIRNVSVTGEPIQLLTGANRDALMSKETAARLRQATEADQARELLERELEGGASASAGLDELAERVALAREAREGVAQVKLDVLVVEDGALVDLDAATCSFKGDEVMIRDTIRGEEGAIVALVEGLIRDVMCGIDRARDVRVAPGSLKLPLRHFERVDLSEVELSNGSVLLQLASWLRLSPTVVELALNARQLTPQALLLLERAVASGALAALQSVHIVDEHQLLDVQGRLRSAAACHGGRVRIVSSTSLDASQVLGSDAWRPGQAHGADEPQQVCASAHDVPMPAAAAGPRDRDRDLMRSAEGGVQVGPSRFTWLRTARGLGRAVLGRAANGASSTVRSTTCSTEQQQARLPAGAMRQLVRGTSSSRLTPLLIESPMSDFASVNEPRRRLSGGHHTRTSGGPAELGIVPLRRNSSSRDTNKGRFVQLEEAAPYDGHGGAALDSVLVDDGTGPQDETELTSIEHRIA